MRGWDGGKSLGSVRALSLHSSAICQSLIFAGYAGPVGGMNQPRAQALAPVVSRPSDRAFSSLQQALLPGDHHLMSNDHAALPFCPHCRQAMKLIRKLEISPEVSVFYCALCKHAETRVQERCAPEAEERAA